MDSAYPDSWATTSHTSSLAATAPTLLSRAKSASAGQGRSASLGCRGLAQDRELCLTLHTAITLHHGVAE
jgi:hypothetical protein